MTNDTVTSEVSIPPEVVEKAREAESLLRQVTSLTITDNQQYQTAGDFLKKVKSRYKDIEDDRKTITAPMNAALKAINNYFKTPQTVLLQAESFLKKALVSYHTEQERKAQQEQARLNELARRDAEKKAIQLEAQAQKALKKGQTEKAEDLMTVKDTIVPVAVVAPSAPPKTSGQSFKTVWKWVVTDAALIPRSYMVLDEKQLNAIAKAGIKGAMAIPGVEFKEDTVMSVRT